MSIDWSKAPEWAIAHALYAFGGEISEVWVGEFQYQRLDISTDYPYGGGNGDARHNPRRSQFRYETPKPSAWDGEGLPPVGTICEHQGSNGWSNPFKAEVIAHKAFKGHADGDVLVVFATDTDVSFSSAFCFRPIRTAEQIAAEERVAGINQMRIDAGSLNSYPFDQLYDAGYRKVTP